jgi:preprotein translocase subunit SecD
VARSTPVKKAWRSLTWLLVIIVGLIALNGAGAIWAGWNWTPKLALDLEGGTQIILAPQLESGQSVTGEQLDQAVAIIRQRIDASGVSEAEINTQGDRNVVVSIPGIPDQETIDRIESSAKLEFRPVLYADVAPTSEVGGDDGTETEAPDAEGEEPTPSPSLNSTPTASPTNASDTNWITEKLFDDFTNFDCAKLDEAGTNVAPEGEPLITCDDQRTYKYILGPVEVRGANIADASHGLSVNSQGVTTGKWAVNMEFDSEGAKAFGDVTRRLVGLDGVLNQFAIVLDGQVITAPTTNSVISDGKAEITGNFTQQSAKTLADQLKFGALPIGFEVQSKETISATLGTSQLGSGLLAGLIGLVLVVVYSLFQYRTLGMLTVASLAVAALVAYLLITVLSWREGYRLSLAGVAGLIVAIGITADSFIVYFERIRDELRDGRSLESAVETGWKRALRTILASDTVNFLAAAVLFLLAVGNVRGFAFTLGLTTIIDIVVVSLFTHPMMQLIARTKFFGEGHRASGLDPRALGAVYRGRAQFRDPVTVPASKRAASGREAARRQTIAERKAQEQATVGAGTGSKGKPQRNKGKDS